MNPITDKLTGVSFGVGRVDGLITLQLATAGEQMLMAGDPDTEVRVIDSIVTGASVKVGLPDLLAWFVRDPRPVTVTLHPLEHRYGASLKAEFSRP